MKDPEDHAEYQLQIRDEQIAALESENAALRTKNETVEKWARSLEELVHVARTDCDALRAEVERLRKGIRYDECGRYR